MKRGTTPVMGLRSGRTVRLGRRVGLPEWARVCGPHELPRAFGTIAVRVSVLRDLRVGRSVVAGARHRTADRRGTGIPSRARGFGAGDPEPMTECRPPADSRGSGTRVEGSRSPGYRPGWTFRERPVACPSRTSRWRSWPPSPTRPRPPERRWRGLPGGRPGGGGHEQRGSARRQSGNPPQAGPPLKEGR